MVLPWDQYRAIITGLYLGEKKTLNQVISIMERDHDFSASKRAYLIHLDRWRVEKYNCTKRNRRREIQNSSPSRSPASPSTGRSLDEASPGTTRGPPRPRPRVLEGTDTSHLHPSRAPSRTAASPPTVTIHSLPYHPSLQPSYYRQSLPRSHTHHHHQSISSTSPSCPYPSAPSPIHGISTSPLSNADGNPCTGNWAAGSEFLGPPTQVDATGGQAGYFPLHCAARLGQSELVGNLVRNGADINGRDVQGYTPLHLATTQAIVQALLAHSANPALQDVNGNTPLHLFLNGHALWSNQRQADLIYSLFDRMDAGTAISVLNTRNRHLQTPFHLMVDQFKAPFSASQAELLCCIVEQIPDARIRMPDGQLPLCVIITQLHVFLQTQGRTSENAHLWERIDNALNTVITSFPGIYPATFLRSLLQLHPRALSLTALWKTTRSLLRVGVDDVSHPHALDGYPLLSYVLSQGYNPDMDRDPALGERASFAIQVLIRKTTEDALNARFSGGLSALEMYVIGWQRHPHFWETTALLIQRKADTSTLADDGFSSDLLRSIAQPEAYPLTALARQSRVPIWVRVWLSACVAEDRSVVLAYLRLLPRAVALAEFTVPLPRYNILVRYLQVYLGRRLQ